MSFLYFIVNDILGQASILIALIAMVGLIALKKSAGQVITGTLKTLLGFLVLLAGANIIVSALNFLGEVFQKGFNMRGVVTDVGSIAGIAQQTLGRETALIMVLAVLDQYSRRAFHPLQIHLPDRAGFAVDGDRLLGSRLYGRPARYRADSAWRNDSRTDVGRHARHRAAYRAQNYRLR